MKSLILFSVYIFTTFSIFSQVVINEVHVKPSGGDTDQAFQSMYNSTATYGSEFVEIYNTSSCSTVDISCWTIGGMDGGTNGGAFSFPSGTVIPPLGFITLGGPNTAGVTFNLNLAANSARLWRSNAARWHLPNGDGWLALYDASGTAVDAVYWTFASNDPGKLNTDATFTSGVLQRIGVCGGGGLATASAIPGIEYIPQASVVGQSYERSSDGGNTWVLGAATPNNCNGTCVTSTAFSLNATIVQPTCGNDNGSISFAPSPSDTYFYTWPFPSNWTVNSVTGLSPGTYDVTITSASGCSIDTTIVLTDIPCGNVCDPNGNLVIYSNYDGGILTINVDQNIPNLKVGICTYEPIQVAFTGPFVGNITEVIYAGMNSNQNNNNCGLGNFTTSVTGVPAGIVTISPPMNPPLVGYIPAHGNGAGPWGGVMLGGTQCDTLNSTGGVNTPDEIVYYFLNATSGTLLYHQTQYACWVNETLNVSAGGNCCIIPPINNPCPTITVNTTGQTNVACFGQTTGSVTVSATGGAATYTYSWTPGNLSGASQSGLGAGTYTVNVLDANNCPGSTTVTITQPGSALSATANATPTNCGVSTGTATAVVSGGTGPYLYSWSPSGGISSTASSLGAGTYSVTVTDDNGCTVTASTTVTTNNGPSVTAGTVTDVSCFGGNNGAASVTGSGGSGTLTYNWSPGGLTGNTQNALSAGTYTVTVFDGGGCTNSTTVTIDQPSDLVVLQGTLVPASCNASDGSASINVSGGTGTYTYQWSPTGGTGATANNISAGTYTVDVEDLNGCTESITIVLTNANGPVVTVQSSMNVTCFGGSNGTASVTVAGGVAPYIYNWSPTGGAGTSATGLSAGTYTVAVTDNTGCVGSTTLTIDQPTAIALTETVIDANCGSADGSISITAAGGAGTYTYSWSPSGGSAAAATGLTAGIYTVTVTDAVGCTASDSYTVNNVGNIPITVSPVELTITAGESVQIQASGATSYTWTNGTTLSCNDCPSPVATPTTTTTYTVTGTDANGCSGIAQVTIIVEIECEELFVPTVFSPNGEGPEVNNELCVFGNCISEVRYEVYNRWGEAVFSTSDPAKCWDGNFKGEPVQTGVYVYSLYAKLFDGKIIEQKGNLTVLR